MSTKLRPKHHLAGEVLVGCLFLSLSLVACGGGGGGEDVRPVAGGFGGDAQNSSFSVLLVVAKDQSNVVDHVELLCAPGGEISGSGTIATNVKIEEGKFTAQSKDATVEGEFVSPTRAEGEISPRSDDVRSCGVSANGTKWTAQCRLGKVEQTEQPSGGKPGTTTAILGTSYLTGGGGTRVVLFGTGSVDVDEGPCGGSANQ